MRKTGNVGRVLPWPLKNGTSRRSVKSYSKLTKAKCITILYSIVLVTVFLAAVFLLFGCSHYNPALYPSYDVLNPGADVRLNPLSLAPDGINYIVNPAFLAWVVELKQEIITLRKKIK